MYGRTRRQARGTRSRCGHLVAASSLPVVAYAAGPMTARTHGTGQFDPSELGALGPGCVIEAEVLVWQPATVRLGAGVYVGHRTMLRGDTRGELVIGDGSWIGQECFMHSAGSIRIGRRVGVGPRVMILTSTHQETASPAPITAAPIEFAPVEIGDGCDVGIGAILLPGTRLGAGVQVGAGAVVTGEVPDGAIVAGVPARVQRFRGQRRASG
jgi:carbonic anhydrase/acetyltransferase-like protein (isoleucine patch superfamily)